MYYHGGHGVQALEAQQPRRQLVVRGHLCRWGTVEICYFGMEDVYKTKSFRCQNSGTRL
jgi:hypothetical protein